MDNSALIKLSGCDKYLQNLICNEFSFLWEDFQIHDWLCDISDSQLHAFLVRVNAVTVTINLNLSDCSITGTGLMPLMGSQVLETLHIAKYALDETRVAKILGTMLPYKF